MMVHWCGCGWERRRAREGLPASQKRGGAERVKRGCNLGTLAPWGRGPEGQAGKLTLQYPSQTTAPVPVAAPPLLWACSLLSLWLPLACESTRPWRAVPTLGASVSGHPSQAASHRTWAAGSVSRGTHASTPWLGPVAASVPPPVPVTWYQVRVRICVPRVGAWHATLVLKLQRRTRRRTERLVRTPWPLRGWRQRCETLPSYVGAFRSCLCRRCAAPCAGPTASGCVTILRPRKTTIGGLEPG
jgi:hypothetical protein